MRHPKRHNRRRARARSQFRRCVRVRSDSETSRALQKARAAVPLQVAEQARAEAAAYPPSSRRPGSPPKPPPVRVPQCLRHPLPALVRWAAWARRAWVAVPRPAAREPMERNTRATRRSGLARTVPTSSGTPTRSSRCLGTRRRPPKRPSSQRRLTGEFRGSAARLGNPTRQYRATPDGHRRHMTRVRLLPNN